MLLFSPLLRRAVTRGGALLPSLVVACAARQTLPPVPTTPEPMVAAESIAAPAPEPPPAPEQPRPSASTDSIVTLIAKPGLWPLDVESARRVLEALGPVTREQPNPSSLELVGGPHGALDRFGVAYALDAQRYWVFGSAGFLLEDPDPELLYRSLRMRLTELLGKPLWTEDDSDTELPTTAWDIGEAMTLSLAPSTDGEIRRVMIAIAEQDEKR